ncbi:NmrA-like family domain-containing protein 1 [Rhizophagus clarus]|uniref:NmrA-like family domain-containing protein 1 n=1 Tax=Rhizophagus clarus TaxID=94130 RepID=A0A8H3MA48_9GLOM|nr:NmrA-like family domain-containing protein 1 [Rhizophagus clarus]
MSQKPLVVVTGATGAQGGSVANSLLATGRYRVRALSRNPDSDKAKALASKGAEVVKFDITVKEDIKSALSGADIAWLVTNFWDKSLVAVDFGEEERLGKLFADIAKEEGINWLIYSSLPDCTAESGGKYPDVIQFTGKNHVEQYIRTLGIPNATFIYLGFYNQNLGTNTPLIPNENGEIEIALPYLEENDQLPVVDAESDTGPIIAKIIEEGPDKWNGKKVPVASEYVTMKHIADVLSEVTGKKYKVRTLDDKGVAEKIPHKNNEQIKQMFKFEKEFGLFGTDNEVKDISIAKKLHPNIKAFEQYARETFGKHK